MSKLIVGKRYYIGVSGANGIYIGRVDHGHGHVFADIKNNDVFVTFNDGYEGCAGFFSPPGDCRLCEPEKQPEPFFYIPLKTP